MSFGFSVGDFVAVVKLVGEISSCLQNVGGAQSEFQELIREFESLNKALNHLDRLDHGTTASQTITSIKCTALSCRIPLESFLAKVKKYEKSLGCWSRSSTVKTVTDKLQWTFRQKDEIKRLQTYLNIHIGTINILLAEHGFERMDLNNSKADEHTRLVREQIKNTNLVLGTIDKDLTGQSFLLHRVHSMLSSLYTLVYGDMKTSLQYFCQAINKVCVSTQQIYTVVLEIRDTLPGLDTRWTYFQTCIRVEDALGLQFTIPSECDYNMLVTIIQRRFQTGAGATDVYAGNYELCLTNKRSELITAETSLMPGIAITMAIIINIATPCNASCPMPGCGSSKATPCPGGAFICCACGVKFDQATKKRRRVDELQEEKNGVTGSCKHHCATCRCRSPTKRPRMENTTAPGQTTGLRNVRWALNEETRLPVEWSKIDTSLIPKFTRVMPSPSQKEDAKIEIQEIYPPRMTSDCLHPSNLGLHSPELPGLELPSYLNYRTHGSLISASHGAGQMARLTIINGETGLD